MSKNRKNCSNKPKFKNNKRVKHENKPKKSEKKKPLSHQQPKNSVVKFTPNIKDIKTCPRNIIHPINKETSDIMANLKTEPGPFRERPELIILSSSSDDEKVIKPPPCKKIKTDPKQTSRPAENGKKKKPETSNQPTKSNPPPRVEKDTNLKDKTKQSPKPSGSGQKKEPEKRKVDNIPNNWLDVSALEIAYPLILEVINAEKQLERGQKVKAIFKTLYNRYGAHQYDGKNIVTEDKCIKLYFSDRESRDRLAQDLEYIIKHGQFEYKLNVIVPVLRRPTIQFLTRTDVNSSNHQNFIVKLKHANNWPGNSFVNWRCTSEIPNTSKFLVKLAVESRIRTWIEKDGGFIYDRDKNGDGEKCEVTDDFGLIRCFQCFNFGHQQSDCERVRRKCVFCSQVLHPVECPFKFEPEHWYCGLCKVRGHTIVSKECPKLMKVLKAALEKYDYRYKYVFLEHDLSRDICEAVLAQRQKNNTNTNANNTNNNNTATTTTSTNQPTHENTKSPPKTPKESKKDPSKLKSLIDSLVDSKMIDPKASGQIYKKLLDHLGTD